ncbi:MAG: leucine-rich repeat domain-containing protein [Oscillospiraceae bacterium]|nr:leucine-rich repeat domain-containing protein [Oscillospiraceae bacterium]
MKKLMALIFAITALLCLSAQAETVGGDCGENGGDNVKWELNTETGELRVFGEGLMADYLFSATDHAPWFNYSDCIHSVIIEEGVISVGYGAFKGGWFGVLYNLESVTLPESLTVISHEAFRQCPALSHIDIPAGVKSIGDYAFAYSGIEEIRFTNCAEIGRWAFYYCQSLKNVYLPATVSEIGGSAFAGCPQLEAVEVAPANQFYFDDGGVLYSREPMTILCYPPAKAMDEYTIPEGVIRIASNAFCLSPSPRKLIIPSTVETIDSQTFISATAPEEFSVSDINTAYSSVDGVLFSKDKAVLVKYPAGKKDETYTAPEGVTTLAAYSFAYNPFLKSLSLPDGISALENYSIYRCPALEQLELPNGIEKFGDRYNTFLFHYCTSLSALRLPQSIKEFNTSSYDTGIVNIELPEGLEKISLSINSIKTIVLPDTLADSRSIDIWNGIVLYRADTKTGSAIKDMHYKEKYIPSIIAFGEEPSVVGKITADREATVNGVTIPLWRINESLYASESDLARCGYSFSWNAGSRTTTITAPDNAVWEVSEAEQESASTADIWSSDVKFVLNGFVIPSLNIGGGESVLDINAVAGRKIY